MHHIKLVLEYDGTAFSGWQKQTGTGLRTVQGVLEEALGKLIGRRVTTYGGGRTDAGVHALGQVVSFSTISSIPPERFPAALGGFLPPDMVVKKGEEVESDFHARYSALGKEYCYLILNRAEPSAVWRNHCYHLPYPLDDLAMQKGAELLKGTHDFYAFSAAGSRVGSSIRRLYSFQVLRKGEWLVFRVKAEGFLYKMVRLLTGTLLEIGRGRFSPDIIAELLETRERGKGGAAAPPQGLYLARIYYPGEEQYLLETGGDEMPPIPPLSFSLDKGTADSLE